MKSILTILMLLISNLLVSGQSIFDINLKNVTSDQSASLKDYQGSEGIVIVFVSTKCPYVKYYESRVQDLISVYKSKNISFLMINANSSESIDVMKNHAINMNTVYLLDSSKGLASFLGAKKNPEVFLLDGNGKTYYQGAIDDNPQVADDVKVNYLKEAIDGLLTGKAVINNNNRPVGCMIK